MRKFKTSVGANAADRQRAEQLQVRVTLMGRAWSLGEEGTASSYKPSVEATLKARHASNAQGNLAVAAVEDWEEF